MNLFSSRLVTANCTAALATVLLGVMAGFFWTYSFNVNYATLELSADDYARMQSLFNVNVRHGMFFSVFFGAAVASTAAVIANLPYRRTASFWCLVVACCAYVFGIVVYTRLVNLPLNATTESWVVGAVPADWHLIRDAWNHANLVRVATSLLAFAASLAAITLRASNTDA